MMNRYRAIEQDRGAGGKFHCGYLPRCCRDQDGFASSSRCLLSKIPRDIRIQTSHLGFPAIENLASRSRCHNAAGEFRLWGFLMASSRSHGAVGIQVRHMKCPWTDDPCWLVGDSFQGVFPSSTDAVHLEHEAKKAPSLRMLYSADR